MANSEVTIDGDTVRKRYLRTDRDQPEREWAALAVLQKHAPGLAPRPIARESHPAAVVMTRVSGVPLDVAFTPLQTHAMVATYRSLYAIPVPRDMPLRFNHPTVFTADTADWLMEQERCGLPEIVNQALDSAARWHTRAPASVQEIHDPVIAQGDGNVTNMLWDGDRVALVDFEYAGVGDLAFEVADLAEHASSRLRGLFDPLVTIAGFELTAAQLARVESYRIVLASFWLLMLLPGNPGHELNPPSSSQQQAKHLLSLLSRNP